MIDQQNCKVKNSGDWDTICPFPVGFVYLSSNSTSPANIYGGQWNALTDGRFLRPYNSWRTLGGSDIHNHWQTVGFYGPDGAQFYAGSGAQITSSRVINNSYVFMTNKNSIDIGNGHVHIMVSNGNRREDATYTAPNLPSYTTCYCWYRTA